jgi:hypothetical protein
MEWTMEQMMEMARKNGKTITPENAALQAYCFNEAARRKTSPLTIMMELQARDTAEKNLGRTDTGNGSPKKPSWKL